MRKKVRATKKCGKKINGQFLKKKKINKHKMKNIVYHFKRENMFLIESEVKTSHCDALFELVHETKNEIRTRIVMSRYDIRLEHCIRQCCMFGMIFWAFKQIHTGSKFVFCQNIFQLTCQRCFTFSSEPGTKKRNRKLISIFMNSHSHSNINIFWKCIHQLL